MTWMRRRVYRQSLYYLHFSQVARQSVGRANIPEPNEGVDVTHVSIEFIVWLMVERLNRRGRYRLRLC